MTPNQIAESFFDQLCEHTESPYDGIGVIAILVGIMAQQSDRPSTEFESIVVTTEHKFINIKIETKYITQEEYEKVVAESKIYEIILAGVKNDRTIN